MFKNRYPPFIPKYRDNLQLIDSRNRLFVATHSNFNLDCFLQFCLLKGVIKNV